MIAAAREKYQLEGEVNKSPQKSSFLTEMQLLGVAQEHLRSKLTPDTYKMWFAPLQAGDTDGNFITLEVANEFCELWLKENYLGVLQDALAIAAGHRLQVKFKINGQ